MEFKEEVYRTFTMTRNELAAREGAFNQLKNTVPRHHQGNLQILRADQEELKRLLRYQEQSRQESGREMKDYIRWGREIKQDLESRLQALAAHVENAEGGTAPTTDHSEGLGNLRMEVPELKVKWTRLSESLLIVRVSIDNTPVLREALCTLNGKVKNLTDEVRPRALWQETEERNQSLPL